MGIKTVAVFSEADRNALFVREAYEAVCIGQAPSKESYLNIEKIIAAAKQTQRPGAGVLDAVHAARRDHYAVAGRHPECFASQRHQAFAVQDVVQLFGDVVPVQVRTAARVDDGFREALVAYRMQVRVQQFADFRAVQGPVWGHLRAPGMAGGQGRLPSAARSFSSLARWAASMPA